MAARLREYSLVQAQNDAYSLFAALGDPVITGLALTNVNDFRAVLIETAIGMPTHAGRW